MLESLLTTYLSGVAMAVVVNRYIGKNRVGIVPQKKRLLQCRDGVEGLKGAENGGENGTW